jgi:hypothetical protein
MAVSVAKEVTQDLAFVVEVEQVSSKIGGSEEETPVSLRVTSIFRNKTVSGSCSTVTPTRSPHPARPSPWSRPDQMTCRGGLPLRSER